MRRDEQYPYREGVVLKRPTKKGKGCFVDCGIDKVRFRSGVNVSVGLEGCYVVLSGFYHLCGARIYNIYMMKH